ncbi:hypothetical protein OA092_01200, partial [bacterium]|nr:hypothetical protein [bacterium]
MSIFLGGASFFFKDKGGRFRLFIVNDNAETTGKSSWENYGDIINTEKQNTRIYSLLMPIAFCFSQCNQSINLIKPKELPYFLNKKHNIYPLRNKRNFYNFSFTGPVMDYKSIFSYILDSDFKPDINPPSFYNRVVKNYIKFIKKESFKNFNHVITLTLRSYDFQKGRNTLSEDIDYIINFCIKNNLLLIIVPDTDRVPTSEQNLILKKYKNIIWDAPSHCIFLRLSLYQESLLNIMNLNGPMTLAILGSKSRSI